MPKTTQEILEESTRVAQDAAKMIGGTFERGVGYTPGVIGSSDLAPATPINVSTPNYPPVYPIAGLGTQLTMTQPETQAQDLTTQIQGLYSGLTGESAYRAEQEKTAGMEAFNKTQQDLSSRLKAIQNEALAIPLQLQQEATGKGITTGGLRPLETGRLRENAIQALGVASLLEASRGNITLAQNLVDRAVAQKYDPIREEIAAKTANLELILKSPAYSFADKNRAEAQKAIQEARTKTVAKQEANEKEIKDYAVMAAQYGATPDVLQRIQSAGSPEAALRIAGTYLGESFRQEMEDKAFQKKLQEATLNLSYSKFEEDKRQFNLQYAIAERDRAEKALATLQKNNPVATAEATGEVLQGKIDLIDSLIIHSGLDSRVGPTRATRGAFAIADKFGAGQDFAAGVTQLVNKETIDTLVNLKARGGTLGALSDQERILLQSSATKIGSWEIKKDGMGIGKYNIDEESFKKELEKIKQLAITAKARALSGYTEQTPAKDEASELRAAGYSEEQIRLILELN